MYKETVIVEKFEDGAIFARPMHSTEQRQAARHWATDLPYSNAVVCEEVVEINTPIELIELQCGAKYWFAGDKLLDELTPVLCAAARLRRQ